MNVAFLNPFVEAARDVFLAETQLDVIRGDISLETSAFTADDVTVLISLVGDVRGVVMLGMSVETGLALVERMMSQSFATFDRLAQSGVAELGNVITGRASVKLEEAGFEADISPPTMVRGKGVTVSSLEFQRLKVPLMNDLGEINIQLALEVSPIESKTENHIPIVAPETSDPNRSA